MKCSIKLLFNFGHVVDGDMNQKDGGASTGRMGAERAATTAASVTFVYNIIEVHNGGIYCR